LFDPVDRSGWCQRGRSRRRFRFGRSRLGDGRERSRLFDGLHSLLGQHFIGGAHRQLEEPGGRRLANRVVRIESYEPAEQLDIGQPGRGGQTHPRIGIVRGERSKDVLLLV
jgi:hypothetical protein